MNLKSEFEQLIAALNAANVDYAICGGLALAMYGHPRFTQDIDVLILPDDLEELMTTVAKIGFTMDSGDIPLQTRDGNEVRIRRIVKVADTQFLMLDVILASDTMTEIWNSRHWLQIDHQRVCVVSREGLIAMKRSAGRTQDLADLEKLEEADE